MAVSVAFLISCVHVPVFVADDTNKSSSFNK